MTKNTRHPSWKTAQPHSAKTGRIVTKNYADANPSKVGWVTAKTGKAGAKAQLLTQEKSR